MAASSPSFPIRVLEDRKDRMTARPLESILSCASRVNNRFLGFLESSPAERFALVLGPSVRGIDRSRLQTIEAIEGAVEEVVVPENDDDWIEAKPVMKYPACTFQNDAWA